MKKTTAMMRIALIILCTIAIFGAVPVFSEETALPSLQEANAVYFYHLETSSTVLSKNQDAVISAGSTVKIMAGLLFCEQLEGRLKDTVIITKSMVANASGYRYNMKAGEEYSVEELLYLALCGSYNDAYDALAVYIADSKEAFLEQMNQRAAALGTKNALFSDISGVADNSQTTVTDLFTIALTAYHNELYMQISATLRYKLSDGTTIKNRNELISSNTYYNDKCKGMSAGSTARAGNCVVTVADNGSESYLCIVMGGQNGENEQNFGYVIANRMIDWVYKTYSYMEVITPETVICTIPVTVSDLTSEIEVRAKESLSCYLPAGLVIGEDITYSIRLIHTELEAPVAEGMPVGYVAVLWNGKTLGTVPLYTAGTAERSGFVSSLKSIQALTEGRAFRAGAIFFTTVFIGWMVTEYILLRQRRHKWDKYFSAKMSPPPLKNNQQKK